MNEEKIDGCGFERPSRPVPPQVYCPRLEQKRPVVDHADCPFCFGKPPEIAHGNHGAFCDWKIARDPVNFGFPPHATRNRIA